MSTPAGLPVGPGGGATGPGLPMMDARAARMQKQAEQRLRMVETLEKIRHVLVVMSGKGGVGKSTVATNLAGALARRGHKVGLCDVDVTNPNIPTMTGLRGAPVEGEGESIIPVDGPGGIKVISAGFLLDTEDRAIVWRGPMKMSLILEFLSNVKWGPLDFLVIDLPPGTSDEPLTIAQSIPEADGAIIVTQPQEVSVEDIRKSIRFAETVKLRVLGIVENMAGYVCPHCGEEADLFGKGGGEATAKQYRVPFLGRIPFDPAMVRLADEGKLFVLERADAPAAKAIEGVVESVLRALPKK
ncbi:MAG: P-loop NTPase [Methanobacteriota archaeon]